jgi:cytochrome c2
MRKRYLALVSLVIGAMFVLAACAQAEEPTATSVVFEPTPAGGQPTPTATATGATSTPATATPTQAAGGGDAAHGQELFASNNCSACHSTGSTTLVGPGLAGVYERAATRVEGLTADEYITESIHDPSAYVVEGFISPSQMIPFPNMPAADVADLIAYLKTLQ